MKKALSTALENTSRVLLGCHGAQRRDLGSANADRFIPLLALATPALFAAFALSEVGKYCIGELGRQIRLREKAPASPSLRGTPAPEEIADDWGRQPRSLATCLRIGSRLADLDPTLDHSLVRRKAANGKMTIRARKGGMKGWLADHRIPAGYSTVMRYKKLAQRLRQLLELDDRLPLEWVMSGLPEGQSLPSALSAPHAAAHRRLAKLLKENPTLGSLTRAVEKALGIVRLVTVRKAHGAGGKEQGGKADFSVISHGRRVNAGEERVEGTKGAMARLLGEKNLSGQALHLQNRIKAWLAGIAAASDKTVETPKVAPRPAQVKGTGGSGGGRGR